MKYFREIEMGYLYLYRISSKPNFSLLQGFTCAVLGMSGTFSLQSSYGLTLSHHFRPLLKMIASQ